MCGVEEVANRVVKARGTVAHGSNVLPKGYVAPMSVQVEIGFRWLQESLWTKVHCRRGLGSDSRAAMGLPNR